MDPSEALRRIAYLLEAGRSPSYKVQAFRKAAATVTATDPRRLSELAAAHRLQSLPGIGETTAAVVDEALAGGIPTYLRRLQQEQPAPRGGEPGRLRRALQGDLHGHTDWSDGASSLAEMSDAARHLGHRYWAATDHSPRLTIAHGLDKQRLERQLNDIAALNDRLAPFRILTGIEVDVLDDGALDQSDDLLGQLDVVVASVHSKLRMEPAAMTRRLVAAVDNPHSDILGHCTGRIVVGRGRPPSTFDAAEVFAACAASGTAVEINCRPERLDPPLELLRSAEEAGCLFAVDTDAHAPGQFEWLELGCEQAVAAGIGVERIVNSWPPARLLEWTGSHDR